MRSTNSVILAGIAGFIGGIAAGIFYSSEPCRDLRSQLKEGARERMQGVDARVQGLERQLAGIDENLRHLRDEFSRNLRETLENYRPSGSQPEPWSVDESEVESELRHMPR